MKEIPFRFLLVDGTKVRLQGAGGKDLGQVEMRWALASLGSLSRFEPVGFWIHAGWKEIRKDLNRRLNYRKLQVLFSDGGAGIEESLLGSGMRPQRCVWHGKRDFPYLLYADGVKKGKQVPLVEKLKSIPALQLTKAQLEALRPEDRPWMEKVFRKTQQGFKQLLEALDPKKYPKARVYIQNLMKPVTTFLSWWLQKGEVIPLNTNAIESAFSQVCNRIKRVGRRWSEQGLLSWLRVAFYKIFKSDLWDLQWLGNRKRLPKIKLISLQISYSWSNSIT
jgi:transposase-like protein